jgi:hypothetical protein
MVPIRRLRADNWSMFMKPMTVFTCALLTLTFLSLPVPVRADGFITPFYGFNFGGDSANCLTLTNCKEKRRNWGVSMGTMGSVLGFEEDLSWASNFYGETTTGDNSLFTAMSNLMLGVGVGPVRPYFLGGVGLIRSHVKSGVGSVTSLDEGKNSIGYDLGGGVNVLFGHVGFRGDIRQFKTFEESALPLPLFNDEKLDYWRGSLGLALFF